MVSGTITGSSKGYFNVLSGQQLHEDENVVNVVTLTNSWSMSSLPQDTCSYMNFVLLHFGFVILVFIVSINAMWINITVHMTSHKSTDTVFRETLWAGKVNPCSECLF